MKFVVQALGLTGGGGKELAMNLFSRLTTYKRHRFIFVVPDLAEYRCLGGSNSKVIVWQKPTGLWGRDFQLNQTLNIVCAKWDCDALLCTANFAPRQPACNTVVLLQNAYVAYREPVVERHLTIRERLTVAYGRRAYRRLSPRVRLVAQTEVMKQRLLASYGFDPRRIQVIPNGCSLPRGSAPCQAPEPKRPFVFLCLGWYYVHKNLEILPEALRQIRAYSSRPVECRITISPDQHPRARRFLREVENMADVIVNLGPVLRSELARIYASADALLLPTLLESFSRTYLEAMHFSLPILTSDRDFARHICQDAALYFDPLDADSVARSMARIMEDGELRARLVQNGKRLISRSPTWDEIAAQFVKVLEDAAASPRVPPSRKALALTERASRVAQSFVFELCGSSVRKSPRPD
jgi:glycosyltransferase involved in cell wall biosynthesis